MQFHCLQIHERDVCAYTKFNTSSDLPPYISVILQATATATETLNYEVTVSGIKIEHDEDSIVIVIYKSRNECGMFFITMLYKNILHIIHVVSSLPSLESAEPLPTESSNEGKNYQTNIIMHYNALQSFQDIL